LAFFNNACGYACSDHASWDRAGYAAAFPFEAPFGEANPYAHTDQDTIAILNIDHGLQFVRLGIGFMVELGGVAQQ